MKKKIAIITVTYNRKEYCEKAIQQFLDFSHPNYELEIFIYDNASTDGTSDYLKLLETKSSNVTVLYGDKNLGTAGGYQTLLEKEIFNKGFDFIVKNDDDEYLPEDWAGILDYWQGMDFLDVLLVGYKRSCTRDYFDGLEWISREPEHKIPIFFGDNECYRSYIAVGPQITTEKGWRALFPALSDYGEKFGGWDVSIARKIKELNKKCLVVYNKECIHFQRWEDHPEYTKEKFRQIKRVQEKIKEFDQERISQ